MAKLRIAFSGIGAVGGYYGGMVAARYQGTIKADIFFIARGENLKAIREKGLQMQLGIRTIHTAPALATDNPAEIGPVDYLFCCTKSYDLEENIQQLKPVIGPKTVIIPLLNGLDIEDEKWLQQYLEESKPAKPSKKAQQKGFTTGLSEGNRFPWWKRHRGS